MNSRILRALDKAQNGNYGLLLKNADKHFNLADQDVSKKIEGVYECSVKHFDYINDYQVYVRYVFKNGTVTVTAGVSGRKYLAIPAYNEFEVASSYWIMDGMLHYGSELQGYEHLNPLPNGGVPFALLGDESLLIMAANNQTETHMPIYLKRIF